MNTTPIRIVILGGGFGGIYTALELERLSRSRKDIEITLVNEENYVVFTPMLHEIAGNDLDPAMIVNPIRKLLRRTNFFCGRVDSVNLVAKSVRVSHGESQHSHDLYYDHLVVAMGSVTHFFGSKELERYALTMRSLADAIDLKNRMIGMLEEADFECCRSLRERLLTFVIAGGGFAGVETAAAVQDFLYQVVKYYPNLTKNDLRVMIVHSGKSLLPELDQRLGNYAGRILQQRSVEILYGTKVSGFDGAVATLSNGMTVETCNVIWTVGNAANPIVSTLPCRHENGRILVRDTMQLPEWPTVWSLGDCAAIPNGATGTFFPPTAQHATRQAKVLARNIFAVLNGKPLTPFRFKMLGQLASLGHRSGVAQIMGIRFSGFIAWWLWRTIYLMKLPRLERRLRVALDWTLDLFLSKDIVQLPARRRAGVSQPPIATTDSTLPFSKTA